MKKTVRIIGLIFTFFVCTLFSACKVNYKNLRISFYSGSGEQVESVRLLLDDDELASATMAIQFDGIKEENIDQVLVYDYPSGLVKIENGTVQGNKYFVNLQASSAGNGRLYVKHLASNKTASIDLKVDKKSSYVKAKVSEYVVSIPTEDERTFTLNINDLIEQDGTNQIAFTTDTTNNRVSGVTFTTAKFEEDMTEEYITGFEVSSSVLHNSSLKIYPVSFMQGDEEVKTYLDQEITITFAKPLTEETFVLDIDDDHKENGNIDWKNPIYLIAKDTTAVINQNDDGKVRWAYQMNNIALDLKYIAEENPYDLIGDTSEKYYSKYYDLKWEIPSRFENIIIATINEKNQLVIEAKDYADEIADIKIRLVPKIDGDLDIVERTVRVKCEIKPTEYEISVQGKIQANNGTKNVYDIDLYDYYRTSVYGASFTFRPLMEYSYADLKNIKIRLNPEILDVKTDKNPDGVHATITNGENLTTTAVASNKYLLRFYLDGKPLEFEVDDRDESMVVSKGILYQQDLKRIQIKYTEISTNNDDKSLTCYVENYYSGDKTYLKNVKPTTATLQFNHKEGITDITIYGGELTSTSGTKLDHIETITDENAEVKVSNVYLNRADTKNYAIYASKIFGDKNKIISSASINVKVIGGGKNPLKLQQNIDNSTLGQEIRYDYNASQGASNNAILMVTDSNTDVGYYTIQFVNNDEVIYTINCLVYEQLTEKDVNYVVPDNKYLIQNKQFDAESNDYVYKYGDYSSEYIVKADKNNSIELFVNIPEQFTSDYIAGVDFELSLNEQKISDYVESFVNNRKISLIFKKGSYLEAENGYITLNAKIKTQKFTNILTKDDNYDEVKISTTFFVYEEITKQDISLNVTNIKGYWNSSLSAYLKDLSMADLKVSLPSDKAYLWNYVQPQKQDLENYKIGIEYQKLASDAEFDVNTKYYNSYGVEQPVDAENFEQLKNSLYTLAPNYQVIWYATMFDGSNPEYVLNATEQSQRGIKLEFVGNSSSISCDVYAQIKQFDLPELTLKCHIEISVPVVTTNLYLTSETKQIQNGNQSVISLIAGQEYEVQVEQYSTEFENLPSYQRFVTNPGFEMVVVDSNGNIYDSVVSVSGNNRNILKVKSEFILTSNLKLIVFAKDALASKLSESASGYENPQNFLMENHKSAYISIDLVVSNGTSANPYPIYDEDDFWQINKDALAKTKYYRLMNNIYLNKIEAISGFSGGIDTLSTQTYQTIYGVKLTNDNLNLFTNFAGSMENINFDVTYEIKEYNVSPKNNASDKDINIGVFDVTKETANLTNVSSTSNGSITFEGKTHSDNSQLNNYIYIGGLVGTNSGTIKYLSHSVSNSATLYLSGDYGYFGGLVGWNKGTINGVEQSEDSKAGQNITYTTYYADQGITQVVNLTASGFSSGALGGLVGLNNGDIQNGYVSGQINQESQKLNNVGGVIGKNTQTQKSVGIGLSGTSLNSITFNETSTILLNLKSSVQITANDNIGGITGVDENGLYSNAKYQILASSTYGINANSYVGGIIGNASDSMLEYCSVYSYRWNYTSDDLKDKSADIIGKADTAGFIGFAKSTNTSISAGDNNQITAIKNSSINGYIDGSHAFIAKSENTNAIIDLYMLGYTTNVDFNLKGGSDGKSDTVNINYAYAYIINKTDENKEISIGEIVSGADGIIRSGWAKNDKINASKPYILAKGQQIKPLFDVAPTSVSLQLKDEMEAIYGVKDSNGELVSGIININLFDYNLDPNSESYTKDYQAQTDKNTHKLDELFNITAEPADFLTEVRLSVTSSDSSVVLVSNSSLIVRSAGQAVITFKSVLNSAVEAHITINVANPIGDNVSLYLARDNTTIRGQESEPTNKYIVKLTKNEAVLLNYLSSSTEIWNQGTSNQTIMNLATNKQTYLLVQVSYTGTLEKDKTINDYLQISGQQLESDGSIELNYNTPFSIKAVEKIEDVTFNFTVTPYMIVYFGNAKYKITSNKTIYFDVQTVSGVSNISLSTEKVILYPNDTTIITAYLTTDKAILTNENAYELIDNIQFNESTITDISTYISIIKIGDWANDKQTIKYQLTMPGENDYNLHENNTMIINFAASGDLGTGVRNSVQLSLLKQRIDELVVRNYIYECNNDGEFDYTKYTQKNTLRPVGEGLITIDISPINGYYDYLEISDITGGEEIVFVQTDAPHGKRVLENVQASSDNLGIRLKNPSTVNKDDDKTIYIATMIDANYTSRKHTVQVRAYVEGELIKSTNMEIDVKMLPEANIYLVKSDGTIVRNWNGNQYIAANTTIRFKVETKNSDDVEPTVEAVIGNAKQTVTNEGNGIYSVKLTDTAGSTLTIKATTYLTLNNGDIEEATTTVDYLIENYVINDMSVTHSTTTTVDGEKQTKIYGNLGTNVGIEFYFNNTDLDYKDNLDSYTKDTYKDGTKGYPISNLLATINGENALNYLSFDISRVKLDDGETITTNDTKTEVYIEKDEKSTTVATLSASSSGINVMMNKDLDIDLKLTLGLKLDNEHNFVLAADNETPVLTKTFTYQLDFIEESSFLEPIAVRTQEDFENMSSGGDYILANDIELVAYNPINVKLNTFDGNGHKISIKSFGTFSDANISAGLFKQIEEGMVVSNLTIEYSLGDASKEYFYNLCNDTENVSYTDANFGGVTATNSGVITNCHVVGKIALCATGVEQVVSNDEIDFNIAGLVAENTSTGRITHSSSQLDVSAKANIAGVVYTNSGKIASTYFDARENKGKIYAYNNNVVVPYSINVAGFVFSNEAGGEISMSYVESGTHTRNGSKIGNISAKDYSSGFVFENRGSVYDCYADIELIGESSHNHISGFVYDNSGSVSNCYSYINKGNKTNLLSMFALENSTGISNCYEVKQDTVGYDNNVDGLTTVSVLNRTLKTSYPTFMFGDNANAVWQILNSSLPKISSTQDKVEFTGSTFDSDAEKNAEYPSRIHGLKDLELVRTEIKDDNGVVINVEYKYKLIANDYGEKQNPILIYDLTTWNYYLGQTDKSNSYFNNTKYYYRILNDISFEQVYDNPTTSKYQFNGNIQGNNMDVSGFKIFSSENLDCIGLFGSLISLNNKSMENAIRNLDLLPTKVTASRTKSVGVLAGLAENFNLYNIDVDAAGVTIVGGNAVGGVVGLIRGKFDIDGISSNIGAYSSRSQQDNNYSIYLSKYQATRFSSDNLSSVYYAGSAFGILDTYSSSTVNHLNVAGNLTLQGDTVGAAIGLIGKNVKVSNAIVDVVAGKISGYQYSGGFAGENRGTISQATVSIKGENLFKNSTFVSSGLVGFNLGGTIENVSVYAEISKVNQSIVAGIVGRNLNGSVKNSTIDGLLDGYFVGGIIGADYNIDTFMARTAAGGGGAIRISKSDLTSLASSTSTIENVALSSNLVDSLLLNLNSFYSVKILDNELKIDCKKVLGLAIGLTDKENVSFKFGYDSTNKCIVINNSKFTTALSNIKYGEDDITVAGEDDAPDDIFAILSGYPLPEKFADNFAIMFIAGAKVESFDFCLLSNGYIKSTMFAIKR